jgi:predicted nucleic acid-binding protein
MSKVFWDSMLFIYWMEGHPGYSPRVLQILNSMDARGDSLYSSVLAVGEVLVGPQKKNANDVITRIETYFRSEMVRLLPFDHKAAIRYSQIRARMNVEAPDAIHLACAASEGIDVFITNDKNLVGKSVPGIQFIVGLDTNLF